MSRTPSWSTPSGAVMEVVGPSPCTRHPWRDGHRGCHGPGGRRRCPSQRRPLCGHQRTHAMAGVVAVVAHAATLHVDVVCCRGVGFGRLQLPSLPWPPPFPHQAATVAAVSHPPRHRGRHLVPNRGWSMTLTIEAAADVGDCHSPPRRCSHRLALRRRQLRAPVLHSWTSHVLRYCLVHSFICPTRQVGMCIVRPPSSSVSLSSSTCFIPFPLFAGHDVKPHKAVPLCCGVIFFSYCGLLLFSYHVSYVVLVMGAV